MPGTAKRWNKSFVIRALIVPLLAVLVLVTQYRGNGYDDTGAYAAAAVFALLVDLATFVGGGARDTLVVLASLVFGLGVLDGYAAYKLPKIDLTNAPGLWGPRPVLGWGPTRAGAFLNQEKIRDGATLFKATYTIDKDLLRVTHTNPAGPTIAFFGDSFTFGYGIDDPETLPQQFANLEPDFNVVNLAYSAYGPAQVLREMQVGLFDNRLTSPRLFFMLTAPWHAERTSCRVVVSGPGPRYALVDGKVIYTGRCAEGTWGRFVEAVRSLAFYRYYLETILQRPHHDDIKTWIAIVDEIIKTTHDKYDVPLVVLYEFPEPRYLDGTGYTNEAIEANFRAAGAHVIDTKVQGAPDDVLEIPGDGHPTGTHNRLFARKVVDDLQAAMPGVLKSTPDASSAKN